MRLAIDVGGVLIERAMAPAAEDAGEDTVFTPDAVRWVAGALEGIERLAALGYELWILSFCGARREAETRIALQAVGVDRSIPVERWLFCRKRTLKKVLMREHNLDLLVDDREDNVRGCQREGFDVIWFEGRPTDPLSLPSWAAVVERFERERALVVATEDLPPVVPHEEAKGSEPGGGGGSPAESLLHEPLADA